MKRFLLIIGLVALPFLLAAQQVTGKVLRLNSDSTIAHASVYISGSSTGTTTNKSGFFSLYSSNNAIPIIVSCVGYYSATITNYKFDEPLVIHLKPKENLMSEVRITPGAGASKPTGMSREQMMRMFKREFIGSSDYAESCIITNPDDIDFYYKNNTGTLTAFCSKPIIIHNPTLGYTINYYLDTFAFSKNHLMFVGNYLFKEDQITNQHELKKVKSNREAVYTFSRMRLIRMFWYNKIINASFKVFDDNGDALKINQFVVRDSLGNEYLMLGKGIHLAYDVKYRGDLNCENQYSFINKNGFYGSDLIWSGALGQQRIGDMLPFEFTSDQDNR